MARTVSVGIDIGTYHIKVMVLENATQNGKPAPKILGTGFAESKGLRHGYIMNKAENVAVLTKAVRQAEKMSGMKIRRAIVSVGGIGLSSFASTGATMISRADLEITDLDVEKVASTSQNEIPPAHSQNRKIIHRIPIQYKIDGKTIVGLRPSGMKGTKLEVKTLFITCLEQHLDDLVDVVEEAGIEVLDIVASPIAASLVTLTKTQKIAGAVLANIGAETVSIVVYENDIPISLEVFPLGSNDITNDIALGLKVPLEDAEQIKKGSLIGAEYSKRKLEEIVTARLSDIFDLIDAHLKKIGRNGLLPAGIIITGGGSRLATLEDLAKAALNLPSRIATLSFGGNIRDLGDSVWSVVYGLCLLGLSEEESPFGATLVHHTKNKAIEWIKQFLP